MKILILGGTVFVGRHLVEAARVAGHEVTLFNRGKQNPYLFPEVENLRGDRENAPDLDRAFAGRKWDAILDTCGYVPRVVRLTTERLADKTGLYCFISAVSVYADASRPNQTETAPVKLSLADPTTEALTGETYGPLKARCEQVVMEAFPQRSLIVRPGQIVGPHDQDHRLGYWLHRMKRGGEILTPDRWDAPVQIIDTRDLAQWIIRLLEQKTTGTFNAVGPDYPLTLGDVLAACQAAAPAPDTNLVRVPEAFLLQHGITGWRELPFWTPAREDRDGIRQSSNAKAIAHGLTFRPLENTLADTLASDAATDLTPETETAILAAWANYT